MASPLASSDTARRRFMRAALAGSVVALLLDVLMLSDGRLDLWHQMGLLGSFFDAQGRALLHGHLSVPAASVSFEGFVIGGHTYMYFGPVPALLRLPVLLVTHGLDGRLTQLSMLLALVVLLSAGAGVHWRVREFVRPGAPLGDSERAAVFLMALALGAGGVPLFLASWPVVYHESELWGAALSLAALDAVLAVVARPSGKRIAWAGALSLLAVNSRASVGAGPIIALGLVAIGVGARAAGDVIRDGESRTARAARILAGFGPVVLERPRRVLIFLVVAAVVALGSSLAVNEAKFHSLVGLPLNSQVNTHIDPMQHAAVVANHGSLFGLKFLPTTLLATVRPDALGQTRAFPFIGLPESPPTVIGSVRFIALLPSLSAFTSMPMFCLLLLAGLPLLLRRPEIRPLTGVLVGAAAAFVPALTVPSVATRYLADLLPFLWIGASAGLQALPRSVRLGAAIRRPRGRRAGLAVMGLLVLVAILINGSVGLVEQRLLAPTTSPAQRASFVRTQDDIDRDLGRAPHGIRAGARLPSLAIGPVGDLFDLDHCAGLYVEGVSGSWLAVERGDRSGLHSLSVRFPGAHEPRGPEALVALGAGAKRVTVATQRSGARVIFSVWVARRAIATSAPVSVSSTRPTRVTVQVDPLGGGSFLSVLSNTAGKVLTTGLPFSPSDVIVTGTDPNDPRLGRFSGSVVRISQTLPLCRRLARRAGLP